MTLVELLRTWYKHEPDNCFPFRGHYAIKQPDSRHVIYADSPGLSDLVWLQSGVQHAIALNGWSFVIKYFSGSQTYEATISRGRVFIGIAVEGKPAIALLTAYCKALESQAALEVEALLSPSLLEAMK